MSPNQAALLGLLMMAAAAPALARVDTLLADVPHPGSLVKLSTSHVRLGDVARAADAVEQRAVIYQGSPSWLRLAPADGYWGLAEAGSLDLRLQNGMPWAVTVWVDIEDAKGGHLKGQLALPPGPPQDLVLPLHAVSPRAMGMQVGPPMPWQAADGLRFVVTRLDGQLDPRQVKAVYLGVPAPGAAQTLWVGRLQRGVANPERPAYTALIDRYGQSTRASWPEKVTDDAALKAARQREQEQLSQWLGRRQGLDSYGGRLDALGLHKTGWFHAQKHAGRWWLVTPDGHSFFSLGVNAVVADGARTYVQGREFMFQDLPRGVPWDAFYGERDSRDPQARSRQGIGYNHGRWFDFYAANLYRADGAGWVQAWRQRTLDRLQAWGFNTIGNWSDPALERAHRIAYTVPINISGDFATVSSGFDYWGRMPDPFDPRFAAAAERAVAAASRGVQDDPWLLGYFADNELAWAGTGPQGRWGLAKGSLSGKPDSPAKQAFIAQLKAAYVQPGKLAAAWGLPLQGWDTVAAEGFEAPDPSEAHPAIAADYSAFQRSYGEQYFRQVAAAIHRHDPHHLFLGGRFAVNTPEAVAACAKYCDVVSFNTYTDVPQHGFDATALRQLDKPVLITEFHFGSDDRGPFGKGVASVYTEAQRGEAYARFIAAAADDPVIVGAHWFEYTDQPASGRLLDGENAHIGLVGITDLPFTSFVEAVRTANQKVTGGH